jgi:predicted dehydrogenase
MGQGKLRTAVLGLDENGELLLEAARQTDCLQIEAVADRDAKLADKTAEEYKCAAYDDYRQLIIQNEFDCLLTAAALYSCDEYIRAAIKKKFNILKVAPPGRNFEEAVELVGLAEAEGVKLAVANPGRFAGSFLALRQFLEEGRIEQICLITATCTAGDRPYPAWQADPKLAGGGVLLHNCYPIIDQIVWNFGIPQQVYSLSTSTAGDRQQRQYLTEDTALLTMRFTDTFIGSLTASRCVGTGPEQGYLKVYGNDRLLTVSDTQLTVSDSLGQTQEELKYEDDELSCMIRQLENFGLSIGLAEQNRLSSSGRENLNNMAVIEAAYLSARTAVPEEPGRILEMGRLEPTNP